MIYHLILHRFGVNVFRKCKGWKYTFLVGRHMAAWWEHSKTQLCFYWVANYWSNQGCTKSKLLFNYTTTQISSCGMCGEVFLEMESDCKQVCGRCDQTHELLLLVAEGQDEVRVWGIHWSHTLISTRHRGQLSVITAEAGLEPGLCRKQGNTTRNKDEC